MQARSTSFKRIGLLALCLALAGCLVTPVCMNLLRERATFRLIASIKQGDTQAALAFLRQGVDANARDSEEKPVPFWYQVVAAFRKAWRGEVKTGSVAKPHMLELAIRTKQALVVKALLESGADPNLVTAEGVPVLHLAVKEKQAEIVTYLLAHKASVDARDRSGQTALMLAAWAANLKIVQMLVAHGADIHARDKEGQTVLMYASSGGDPAIVKWLLAHGAKADVNVKDNMGYTPAMEALRHASYEVESLLFEAGAKE